MSSDKKLAGPKIIMSTWAGLCRRRGRRLEEMQCLSGQLGLGTRFRQQDTRARRSARSTWGAGVPKKRRSWGQRSWVQIPPAPPYAEPTPVSEIAALAFYLKKNGYKESTIRGTVHTLKALAHHVNLLDPEAVKAYLAKAECSVNRKGKVVEDLDRFYKYKAIEWQKPNYQRVDVLPFVPTTQEVNDLIACLGPKMSVFVLLLKESGARFGEGFNLRWQDLNTEN